MHLDVITSVEQFEGLAACWDELAGHVPLRGWHWLSSWWKQYGNERSLCIVTARDSSGTLVGVAPFFLESDAARGRTLQLLGGGEVCSDYLDILARPECQPAFLEALAAWLNEQAVQGGPHRWDLLYLEGLVRCDCLAEKLANRLAADGHSIHSRPAQHCWRIELPTCWEDFLSRLSKSHRKQVRRVQQRLLDSGRARLRVAETDQELSQFMKILVDLHQRRRIQLGQPGCFASARFTRFLHDAAEQLLAIRQLRLSVLEVDGCASAAEFSLISAGVVYSYQSGIEPDALEEEPGRAATIATIQRAIEEGATAFDFLRGDEPYKSHWRAQPHECLQLRIASRTAGAQLRHGIWLAGDTLKQWVKGSFGLAGTG